MRMHHLRSLTLISIVFASSTLFAAVDSSQPTVVSQRPVAVEGESGLTLLAQPVARVNRVGESLQVAFAGSHADGVVFSAVDLPPGLSMDAATGAVSGTLGPHAAGEYYTVVSARTPQLTERVWFPWSVLKSAQPEVQNPGLLLNASGSTVDLTVVGRSLDGDALTYTAYGLPRGLAIDAKTGRITGRIEPHELRTTYTVSVVASDGPTTSGVVFTWIVLANEP